MGFVWLADKPNRTREEIARIVHGVSLARGLDELATVIALMTISTEVGANDRAGQRQWWCPWNAKDPQTQEFVHDSQSDDGLSSGYLQQQVSAPGAQGRPWGWGGLFGDREGARKRMTLVDSVDMFLAALTNDWQRAANNPRLAGQFAQAVQKSAYPDRYAEKWDEAWTVLRRALAGQPAPVITPPKQVGWTGDPIWLPDVLRDAGLVCHIYPGAFDRGHGDMGDIWGVMCHHTGSFGETPRGIAEHPSLGLASQLYLGRNGEYTLCGVGVAYHAGRGSWPGLPTNNANNRLIGIEAANDGGGTPGKPHRFSWPDVQYDAYVTGVAAILSKLGYGADRAIGHKDWAGVAQGKWDPGAFDMPTFRGDVSTKLVGEDWTTVYNEIMGVI